MARGLALGLAGLLLIGAASVPAFAAPTTAPAELAGVLVVTDEEVNEPVPEELRDALGAYDQLAAAHPGDFGYPHVSGGEIVVGVSTAGGASKAAALKKQLVNGPTDGSVEDSKGGGVVEDGKKDEAVDPSARIGATRDGGAAAVSPAEEAIAAAEKAKVAVEAARRAAAATRATAAARAAAERAQIKTVPATQAGLAQVVEQIMNAIDTDPLLSSAGIWQTEIDRETARVAISMESITDEVAQRLATLFGDRIELVQAPNPQLTETVGRLNDGSPFYGGAQLRTPSGVACSTAFSWNITSRVSGMLTAGHCARDGGNVSTPAGAMGHISSGTRENFSSRGTVYLPGERVYRGDMALITINSGKSSAGRVYRGAHNSITSAPVRSMWHRRSQAGDKFCTSASKSGEVCDWTVKDVGVNNRTSNGLWIRNIVTSKAKREACIRPGDSGGAIYTVNADGAVAAKGIINAGSGGGSDYRGGFLDPCYSGFTDIWDAYSGFPGYLKVS